MFDTLKKTVSAVCGKVSDHGKTLAIAGIMTLGAVSSFAEGEVVIPETGINVSGYITAGISTIGAVVATAVGGYVAFLVVRKALRWVGKALG